MKDLKDIASSPVTQRLGMAVSRYAPPALVYRLSWLAAGVVARFSPPVFQVLQDNLRQVLGPDVDQTDLKQTARKALHTTIHGYYDLYRAVQKSREKLSTIVDLPESTIQIFRSLRTQESGTVLVSAHLGNFDLGGYVAVDYLPEAQLISLPNPSPGFQLTNEIRESSGLTVTPLSPTALREAIRLLRRGGVVAVGGDRPVSDQDESVSFFGRPARVPSGHVRMALATGASIVLTYCVFSPESGKYILNVEPPISMIRTGDRSEDIRVNMRVVLDGLEVMIRRWSDQWQMYVPVWL